jgi:hypothetical protein
MQELLQLAQTFEKVTARKQGAVATPLTEIHSSLNPPKKANITDCYFLLTEIPKTNNLSSTILLTKINSDKFNSAEANQLNLMNLSKEFFEGTKPMKGIELKSLYKAINKQRNCDINTLL